MMERTSCFLVPVEGAPESYLSGVPWREGEVYVFGCPDADLPVLLHRVRHLKPLGAEGQRPLLGNNVQEARLSGLPTSAWL